MSGTPYQEALAAAHWLALRGVQRLAVVAEDTPGVRLPRRQADVPHLAGAEAREPADRARRRGPTWRASRGRRSRRSRTSSTGPAPPRAPAGSSPRSAAPGSRARSSRRRESESPAFVAAAGPSAADGAFVVAPARAAAPAGRRGRGRSGSRAAYDHAPGRDALQAYDAVRTLAQAITQTGKVDHALNTAQLPRLDLEFTTLLGVGAVRARPHDPGGRPHHPRRAERRLPDRERAALEQWLSSGRSRSPRCCSSAPSRAAAGRRARPARPRSTASPTSRRPTTAPRTRPRADRDYWVDPDYHSHTNYVPLGGIEACPLAQRARREARHAARGRAEGGRADGAVRRRGARPRRLPDAEDHAGRARVRHERDRGRGHGEGHAPRWRSARRAT